MGIKSYKLFLPHITAYEIEKMGQYENIQDLIFIEPLSQDWQAYLCESAGYPFNDLPWTQLRLAQFEIPNSAKVACCIDPVMMQLTHKGAYMIGQNQLNLSQNDAIRVVAQINERLMDQGESLYLVDQHSWLFTSNKSLCLNSETIQSLIGKDMFNFRYGGDDASYWQQFSTEIQMLIKQMIDYQGLSPSPPETILNVHCFDLVEIEKKPAIPFINNDSICVISGNEIIKTFCCKTFLSHKNFSEYQNNPVVGNFDSAKNIIIAFESEKEIYPKLIESWRSVGLTGINQFCQIICQDAVIQFKPRVSFFKRLLGLRI